MLVTEIKRLTHSEWTISWESCKPSINECSDKSLFLRIVSLAGNIFWNLKSRYKNCFYLFIHFSFLYTIFDPYARKIHRIHQTDICMYIKIEVVPYLGHSATNYKVTFLISPLQLQIKAGCQLSVKFILRFGSSEEVALRWGSNLRAVERGRGYQNQ